MLHTTVMRNLLSFVFGLFSGLLFALVRAVLLLDRLICWIYDLPLWAAIARAFHFAQRRRAVCAFTLFVPLFFVPGALLTQSGTLVLADGAPLGFVEDPDMLSAAVTELEESASALAGADYALPVALESRALRATPSQFLTADELKTGLIEASGELDTLAVISVNGEQAGVCRSAEDAQALLDRVKAQYTTATDENADFLQEVRVDEVVAQTSLVSDFGALYDYLAPRLDVTATRSVTYTEDFRINNGVRGSAPNLCAAYSRARCLPSRTGGIRLPGPLHSPFSRSVIGGRVDRVNFRGPLQIGTFGTVQLDNPSAIAAAADRCNPSFPQSISTLQDHSDYFFRCCPRASIRVDLLRQLCGSADKYFPVIHKRRKQSDNPVLPQCRLHSAIRYQFPYVLWTAAEFQFPVFDVPSNASQPGPAATAFFLYQSEAGIHRAADGRSAGDPMEYILRLFFPQMVNEQDGNAVLIRQAF